MFSWLAPWSLYLKLGAFAALVALTIYTTWNVTRAGEEERKLQAVSEAVLNIQKEIDKHAASTKFYRDLAEKRREELLQSIAKIKIEHTTITNNITKEREIVREFYAQPLPPGGYEEWKKARQLVAPLPASGSQP